jgi:hypothetical protein
LRAVQHFSFLHERLSLTTALLFFELVESRGGCNRRETFRWETADCEKEKCEKFTFALHLRLANAPLWLLFIR